jgi:predicted TIM-barrel fold metal-dependent hydrolase
MNVARPIVAPGKPAAATLGLLDCDIHPRPRSVEEYRPWLSAAAWERLQTYGLRPRHGFAKGYPFPKAAPLASRRDAWPPGGPPASDLDFVRFQHLDHYGVDVGILNPLQPSGQGDQNDEFSAAMAHAVNGWQLERWIKDEPRLRASVVLPYEDGAASAAEIRRRAGDRRFAQVLLMSRTAEPLGRKRYWPIYEAAAEAGLPIGIHAFGYSGWAMTNNGWPSFYVEEVSEHATSCQNQVTSFIVEGVFERFSTLKILLIECGFGWLPALGWRLDKHWKKLKAEVPHLKRAPSEYMREHVHVSTQPIDEPERPEHLLDVMEWIGWDRILYASDYPHWDFDDPRTGVPSFIPAERRRDIYGGNARALYNIPAE